MEAYKEAVRVKPQVVISDMKMPKLDGFGLLTALKNVPELKAVPVILVSAGSTEIEEKAFEQGFYDFIPKPLKKATVLTRVKRAFDDAARRNYLFLR